VNKVEMVWWGWLLWLSIPVGAVALGLRKRIDWLTIAGLMYLAIMFCAEYARCR
jgi:hypothetical protein